MTTEMLDTLGVPEFYVTHIGAVEDAGFGLVRIVRCIERNHVLIPVVSSVIPALSIMQGWPRLRDKIQQVICRDSTGMQ